MRLLELNTNKMSREDAINKYNELCNEAQDILFKLSEQMDLAQKELYDISITLDHITGYKLNDDVQMAINNMKYSMRIRHKSQAIKSSSSMIYFIE